MDAETLDRAVRKLTSIGRNIEREARDIPLDDTLRGATELKRIVRSVQRELGDIPLEEQLRAANRRRCHVNRRPSTRRKKE